jgi:hypothetical protein
MSLQSFVQTSARRCESARSERVSSPLRDEMVHGVLPDQPAETFGAQQSMFLKTEQGASLVITQDRTAT